MRLFVFMLLVLFATPSFANNFVVTGADPTPHYTVCADDTLTLRKPLGRELKADGSRDKTFAVWIDRVNGRGFAVDGATKLRGVTVVQGGTSVYAPIDAKACAVVAPPTPVATNTLYGISISGGEFHGVSDGRWLASPADIDSYYAVGYRAFRITFVMPELDNSAAKLVAVANKCIALNVPCMFDNHSFAWPDVATQVAQITRVDGILPKSDLITYGPQNEPAIKDWDKWATDQQAIITAVRAAGVTRFLWVDYPGSSGAQRLDKGERYPKACNSLACAVIKLPGKTLVDPLRKTGLDIHRYFDTSGGGLSMECDKYVFLWTAGHAAPELDLPRMVGEYAYGNDTKVKDTCKTLEPDILREIKESPPITVPYRSGLSMVMLWGGGSRWGSYMFRALPNAASPYIQATTGK